MSYLLVALTSIVLLTSCVKREEVVEQVFPNGEKKIVMYYEGEGSERKPVEQVSYYITGKVEVQGKFDENQKRTGNWTYFYEDGTKWSECEYKSGLRHGKSITYFENGNKRYEGSYENDKQIAHWIFYNEDGSIKNEKDY